MKSNTRSITLNRAYSNPAQKESTKQLITDAISLIQQGLEILASIDYGASTTTRGDLNVSQTTSTFDGLESLIEQADKLVYVKDQLENKPEIARLLDFNLNQDVSLLKLLFRLSNRTYFLRMCDFYKNECLNADRALEHEERAMLEISASLINLDTPVEVQLIDPQPGALWVPKEMDVFKSSTRHSGRVQQSLMPIVKEGTSILRRGLIKV